MAGTTGRPVTDNLHRAADSALRSQRQRLSRRLHDGYAPCSPPARGKNRGPWFPLERRPFEREPPLVRACPDGKVRKAGLLRCVEPDNAASGNGI